MRSGRTSHVCNFRICGTESQPGLQLVEKLATLLAGGIRRARLWSGMLRVPRWREYTLAYSWIILDNCWLHTDCTGLLLIFLWFCCTQVHCNYTLYCTYTESCLISTSCIITCTRIGIITKSSTLYILFSFYQSADHGKTIYGHFTELWLMLEWSR